MSARRSLAIVACLAICASLVAFGESWQTTKTACKQKGFHNKEECVIDLATLEVKGFSPGFGSLGSSNGFGAGLKYKHAWSANNIVTARALYTTNSSYLVEAGYRHLLAPNIRSATTNVPSGSWMPGPGLSTDDRRGKLELKVARYDLRTQDFYGLGPDSSLADHAVYRQQATNATFNAFIPRSTRTEVFGLIGEARYFKPVIQSARGSSLPSVSAKFGDLGAPAVNSRPGIVQLGVGLSMQTPYQKPHVWESHDARIVYRHFEDLASPAFSFHRLDADAAASFELTHHPPAQGPSPQYDFDRSKWKDFWCMQQSDGGCHIGTLSLAGLATTSYTTGSARVPFYLQPTLGGADIDGRDTLRGLVDYRLRAPNRMLMQVEFEKILSQLQIKGEPLGGYGLYTFFDAGNVANQPGELSFAHLRKDVGVGVAIAIQNRTVIRLYIAFGAGEGSHPNAKIASGF